MLHIRNSHGKGDPQKAADYLMSDRDHTGKKRAVAPEILDGDPDTVARIANQTSRAHKYATGCLSFRDNEKPTLSQQKAIMKDFEATFLPSLEKDKNYSIAWVAHWDKGNLELNYFLATTELTTGKQLNPFPPGDLQHEFNDAWVQNANHKLGYDQVVTDPLKINRSKFERKVLPLQEATSALCQQARTHKEIRNGLEDLFRLAIDHDEIKSRQDIIDLLREQGEVTRVGDDYISFKPEGEKKAIRLKGPVFQEGADYQAIKEQAKEYDKSKRSPKELTPEQFQSNKAKIDRLKQTRLEFFKKQYQQKAKKVRTFGPKSMKAKPAKIKQGQPQQQQQPQQSENPMGKVAKMLDEARKENEQSLKKQEAFEKLDNKKQEAAKPSDPIILKSNSNSKQAKPTNHNRRPAISSFGQIAASSMAGFLTIQINYVMASKHALEMQVGTLSIFKESDIKKMFLLKQEIARLDQQIAMLKAQQEQAAEAELIQQQAARYKNNTNKPKPSWV